MPGSLILDPARRKHERRGTMLSAAFDDHSPSGGDVVTGLSVAAGRFASANGGRDLARCLQLFGPSVRQEQRVLDVLRCQAQGRSRCRSRSPRRECIGVFGSADSRSRPVAGCLVTSTAWAERGPRTRPRRVLSLLRTVRGCPRCRGSRPRAPSGVAAISLSTRYRHHQVAAAEAAMALDADVLFDPMTERLTAPGFEN